MPTHDEFGNFHGALKEAPMAVRIFSFFLYTKYVLTCFKIENRKFAY